MADNEKVTIQIETKANLDGIKKTQDGVEKLSESVQESKGIFKGFFEKLKNGFKNPYLAWQGFIGLVQVGIGTLRQGIKFIGESIQAHLESARAVKTLEASYQALGITGTQAIKNAQAFASEMQAATGIADETFLNAQKLMAQYGIVGQKAQEAIKAAYALSQGVGMSFESAMMQLAKASVGATESLSRYGIVLGDGVKEGEKFGAVINQINEKFGAAAQASMGDTITQVNALKESWGDFKEVIGAWLIPAFELLIKVGTKAVNVLNRVFGADKSAIEQAIDKDKQRYAELTRQYEAIEKIALANAKNGQIGEGWAKRLKELDNERVKLYDAITANQQTLNVEKEELAAKEAEINANSLQIAKNTLAAVEAAKEQKKEAAEAAQKSEAKLKTEREILDTLEAQRLTAKSNAEQSSQERIIKATADYSNMSSAELVEARIRLDNEKALQEQITAIKKEALDKQVADAKAAYETANAEELSAKEKAYSDALAQQLVFNEQNLVAQQEYNSQRIALENELTSYNAAAAKLYAKTQTQNFKNAQDLFAQIGQLATSENKKLAAVGKAASIAQATINTYEGATKALAQGGFFGIAMAAAVIASGLASVAQISGVKLAKGGLVKAVTGGVPAVIGEGGSDEAVLPLDSQRSMSRIGQAISDAGGNKQADGVVVNINVSANGGLPAFLEELTEATQNGVTAALRYANVAVKAGNEQSRYSV